MKRVMKKHSIFVGLLIIMVMVLAACGANTNEETETDTGDTAGETRRVNIATTGTRLPYSLMDEEGNWTGTEAALWSEISKRTNWDLEIQRVSGSAIFGQLDTGRSDVAANNYALTEERSENYIYTIPLYADANTIATKSWNDEINTIDNLAGKTVGVAVGQAAEIPLAELSEELGFELIRYEEPVEAFKQLEIDRLDAVGSPRSLLMEYIESSGADFKILEENLTATPIVYYLPDTEEHAQLRDELNVVIEEMREDGTMGAITEEWLYMDMTENLADLESTQE